MIQAYRRWKARRVLRKNDFCVVHLQKWGRYGCDKCRTEKKKRRGDELTEALGVFGVTAVIDGD